jgi:hypothetical protein
MREVHLMAVDLDGKSVTPRSLMQAEQSETTSDQDRVREPTLTIQQLSALAQRQSLILGFSPEALHDV